MAKTIREVLFHLAKRTDDIGLGPAIDEALAQIVEAIDTLKKVNTTGNPRNDEYVDEWNAALDKLAEGHHRLPKVVR